MKVMPSVIQADNTTLSSNVTVSLVISSVCFIALASYLYFKNIYSFWKKKNVLGPKPWPIFGNLLHQIYQNPMKREREWVQKYGKVYGIFQGLSPRLVIADPEVLQQIAIKDFDSFQNHDTNEFTDELRRSFIFLSKGEHWKKVRALMSPTFTSGKIKRMFRYLDGCANDLVDLFSEQLPLGENKHKAESIINVKDLYSLFTMDAITTCCYGLKLERSGSKDLKTAATRNHFVSIAMMLFEISWSRIIFMTTVPKPFLRLIGFKFASVKDIAPLEKTVDQLITKRRKATKKFDDYLQLLIDARLDDKLELNEMDLEENHHAGLTHESLLKDQARMVDELKSNSNVKFELADIDILANAIFLLAVGLETTATLLAHASYALAFHQDIQVKLYDEVTKIAELNEDKSRVSFSYESLTSCKYLDAVLSETLRNLSAVLFLDRVANRDYHIEKYNIHVPKGTILFLAFYALMNDPDYWEEPEKFDPERFMPGNKEKIVPGSYAPFGMGPRHCLGMRFSLTEAKLALAKIIMNFHFYPAPDTEYPPKESKSVFGVHSLKKPFVKLTPRKNIE